MIRLAVVILASLILADPCPGQDAAGPPVPAPAAGEPDHLVPVPPDPVPASYRAAWHARLGVPRGREAGVMIRLPSFEPEECLVIRESADDPPAYTLTHARADRNIWYALAANRDDGRAQTVAVTRTEARLPPDLGRRACRNWDRMLRNVRYPAPGEGEGGCDGVTTEFRRERMYGETWSPEGGSPAALVDLGLALIAACDAPEAKRAEALKQVEERCAALERYLDKAAR